MKPGGTTFGIIARSIFVSICAVGLFMSGQPGFSCPCKDMKVPPPPEKDFDIQSGLDYMKSSEYKKEFSQAIADARKACQKHVGEYRLAVVSDIDETCLNNKQFFVDNPKTNWGEWWGWVRQAKDPALKPTADFLSWARKNGFAIFLITGRNESERASTISNLVSAGLAYDGLYMRPDNDQSPAETMKSKFRKQISDMGFTIVVNIGDQYSDLTGGYAEECIKLPNKIYYIK